MGRLPTAQRAAFPDYTYKLQGMSLREYYAGQALIAIWSNPHVAPGYLRKELAEDVVKIADALCAELDKEK